MIFLEKLDIIYKIGVGLAIGVYQSSLISSLLYSVKISPLKINFIQKFELKLASPSINLKYTKINVTS